MIKKKDAQYHIGVIMEDDTIVMLSISSEDVTSKGLALLAAKEGKALQASFKSMLKHLCEMEGVTDAGT